MTIHKEKILLLRKEGRTYKEIQDELGCSKGTIAYHLGNGQKEKTRNRTRKSRLKIYEYIWSYKENMGCQDCGEKFPYFVLDFDHRQNKSFSIANWTRHTQNIEDIKKEIEKCDVVCANCHRIRTHERLGEE